MAVLLLEYKGILSAAGKSIPVTFSNVSIPFEQSESAALSGTRIWPAMINTNFLHTLIYMGYIIYLLWGALWIMMSEVLKTV